MNDRDTKPENTIRPTEEQMHAETNPPIATEVGLTERKYVDDRDLERLTPFSRSQWQAMRYAKEGPPWRKIGRRVVYSWADVVAWIESRPRGGDRP